MRTQKTNKSGHEYECNHAIAYTTHVMHISQVLSMLLLVLVQHGCHFYFILFPAGSNVFGFDLFSF